MDEGVKAVERERAMNGIVLREDQTGAWGIIAYASVFTRAYIPTRKQTYMSLWSYLTVPCPE